MFIARIKDLRTRNRDAAPIVAGDRIVLDHFRAVGSQRRDAEGDRLDNDHDRNSAGHARQPIAHNHFIGPCLIGGET